MSRLALRRFPHTITRRRHEPGFYNDDGEWTPGSVTETALRASVQPLSNEDLEAGGFSRLVTRYKVFVPATDALAAAFEDSDADEVVYGGETFTVEENRSWPGQHTRATIVRGT